MSDDELIEAMAEAIWRASSFGRYNPGRQPFVEAGDMLGDDVRNQARAALSVTKPVIERALLEQLVREGTKLADECYILRDTGIGGVVLRRM